MDDELLILSLFYDVYTIYNSFTSVLRELFKTKTKMDNYSAIYHFLRLLPSC